LMILLSKTLFNLPWGSTGETILIVRPDVRILFCTKTFSIFETWKSSLTLHG